MTALKTYLPTLAKDLGKSTEKFNEWLRALVAGKALLPRPGRGPGSGVELTAKSLATFLLALLASDFRNHAVELAKMLCKAKPTKYRRCPVTGADNLRDAIAIGLEGRGLLDSKTGSLWQIIVFRGRGVATLYWRMADGEILPIAFSTTNEIANDLFAVDAVLHGAAVEKIVSDLKLLNQDLAK